jgi:acetyl/propionyl-CoA carboxylase alpha subunit
MVTGIDLVAEQLRGGRRNRWGRQDRTGRPEAIECRINAEDPTATSADARTDRGFQSRPAVRSFASTPTLRGYRCRLPYDSLCSSKGSPGRRSPGPSDRPDARALASSPIEGPGIRTTSQFLDRVPAYPFVRGQTRHLAVARSSRRRGTNLSATGRARVPSWEHDGCRRTSPCFALLTAGSAPPPRRRGNHTAARPQRSVHEGDPRTASRHDLAATPG